MLVPRGKILRSRMRTSEVGLCFMNDISHSEYGQKHTNALSWCVQQSTTTPSAFHLCSSLAFKKKPPVPALYLTTVLLPYLPMVLVGRLTSPKIRGGIRRQALQIRPAADGGRGSQQVRALAEKDS